MSVKPKTITPSISGYYILGLNSELTLGNKFDKILKPVKQVRVIGIKRLASGFIPVDLPENENEEIGLNTYYKDLPSLNVEEINFVSSIKEEILQLPNVKDVTHITDDEDVHEITFQIKGNIWRSCHQVQTKRFSLKIKRNHRGFPFFNGICWDMINQRQLGAIAKTVFEALA
jgi:hypothetical protein